MKSEIRVNGHIVAQSYNSDDNHAVTSWQGGILAGDIVSFNANSPYVASLLGMLVKLGLSYSNLESITIQQSGIYRITAHTAYGYLNLIRVG